MNSKSDAFRNHLGLAIAIQRSTCAHSSAWEIPDRDTAALSLLALQTTLLNMKLVNLHPYY